MSFLRAKQPQADPVATPTTITSPADQLNSLANIRRLSGGRNSFAPAAAATPSALRPVTVTGINP